MPVLWRHAGHSSPAVPHPPALPLPPPCPRLSPPAGGVKALYAGLSPTLIRAFPANAAQWLAWELCMQQAARLQQGGAG